jgi:hypothetical protein
MDLTRFTDLASRLRGAADFISTLDLAALPRLHEVRFIWASDDSVLTISAHVGTVFDDEEIIEDLATWARALDSTLYLGPEVRLGDDVRYSHYRELSTTAVLPDETLFKAWNLLSYGYSPRDAVP